MQDGARAHAAKLTLETLKDMKQIWLLELRQWLLNSPDLNPVFLWSGDSWYKMYTEVEG